MKKSLNIIKRQKSKEQSDSRGNCKINFQSDELQKNLNVVKRFKSVFQFASGNLRFSVGMSPAAGCRAGSDMKK